MPSSLGNQSGTRWFRLMLVACVTNGLGAFGLKVLAERKLTGQYEVQYLLLWYLGWLLFGAVVFIWRPFKPVLREIVISAGMGLCSIAGQFFTGLALSRDVAGHVAFPIGTGGTLFVVALAGIVFFKERVGPFGIAGLVLGILSIVVLGVA